MTDIEFEIKKKQRLMESKYTAWIKIENGEVFEGTIEQLDDCFAIRFDDLKMWCGANGWEYTVYDIDVYSL